MSSVQAGRQNGLERCWWCGTDPLYTAYHDEEWGRPVYDDRRLFEKVCLERFQALRVPVTGYRSAICKD